MGGVPRSADAQIALVASTQPADETAMLAAASPMLAAGAQPGLAKNVHIDIAFLRTSPDPVDNLSNVSTPPPDDDSSEDESLPSFNITPSPPEQTWPEEPSPAQPNVSQLPPLPPPDFSCVEAGRAAPQLPSFGAAAPSMDSVAPASAELPSLPCTLDGSSGAAQFGCSGRQHDSFNDSGSGDDGDDQFSLPCAEDTLQPRRSTHDGTVRHPAPISEVNPPPKSAPGAARRRRVQWAPGVMSPNPSRELLHKRARLMAEADERAAILRQQEAANEELGRGKRRKSRP